MVKIIVDVCEEVIGAEVTDFFTSFGKLCLFRITGNIECQTFTALFAPKVLGFKTKVVRGIAEIDPGQKTRTKIKTVRAAWQCSG